MTALDDDKLLRLLYLLSKLCNSGSLSSFVHTCSFGTIWYMFSLLLCANLSYRAYACQTLNSEHKKQVQQATVQLNQEQVDSKWISDELGHR